MQPFFLQLPPKASSFPITYDSKVAFLGSCFAENIGEKFKDHKIPSLVNPLGIVFHPLPLMKLLKRCIERDLFEEQDLFYANERWQSFELHSDFSHINKAVLLKAINDQVIAASQFLKEATHLVLTLGTAWGYKHKASEQIVANCHKVSQQVFQKRLSSQEEIASNFSEVFKRLKRFNPSLHIILTVSPVRHIKDGLIENNRSKAQLLSTTAQLISDMEFVDYYPTYELVIDCLRDYRFFKEDMLHPNEQAIDFVWKHFTATFLFKEETQQTLKKVSEIQRGLMHRPFNPQSEAHQNFEASLQGKIEKIQQQYPFMSF